MLGRSLRVALWTDGESGEESVLWSGGSAKVSRERRTGKPNEAKRGSKVYAAGEMTDILEEFESLK